VGFLTLQNYRDDLGGSGSQVGALQRSNIPTALLDRWVNQAMKEVGYAFKFHESEGIKQWSTVDGQASYSIGPAGNIILTDFWYVIELRKSAPADRIGIILPETRSNYRRKIGNTADSTQRSNPLKYHKYGTSIYLRPIPDSTVVTVDMDYAKNLVPLTGTSDVTPFQEDWDEIVFVGALYRGFRHFGEYDRYINVRNDFLGLVRSRKTEIELEEFPEGGISAVGPTDTEESING